ncbi:hypothetical protein [Nostoc sp.]|uniref:hypothetical protein n=1 Tax=Nostoc sp. TaxID=1180 RepID=UPI002FF91963
MAETLIFSSSLKSLDKFYTSKCFYQFICNNKYFVTFVGLGAGKPSQCGSTTQHYMKVAIDKVRGIVGDLGRVSSVERLRSDRYAKNALANTALPVHLTI